MTPAAPTTNKMIAARICPRPGRSSDESSLPRVFCAGSAAFSVERGRRVATGGWLGFVAVALGAAGAEVAAVAFEVAAEGSSSPASRR
jgi:hypothetical protein